MAAVRKAKAVTIIVGYFFKIFCERVAPITKETDAQINKIFPKIVFVEEFPTSICGSPIIIKAPNSPLATPNRLIRYIFSFKNNHPIKTDNIGIIRVKVDALMTVDLIIPSKKKVIFKVTIKIPMATSFGKSAGFILPPEEERVIFLR